jgi:hypothetical protein
VTFRLFLGVVIASHIRDWDNIASLVEAYKPLSGLCHVFDSDAKVVASLMQRGQLVRNAERT